jgi:hypothetical protein
MDECGPTRASASASPAHQSNPSRTRERSWLTLSSAACITITAGAHWVDPHSLALPECQSAASFLPATIWWLVVGYNRIALPASFQWNKCVLAA